MRLTISPVAEQDIEAIGDLIAQDNPTRALSFTEALYQQCCLIGENPLALSCTSRTGGINQKLHLWPLLAPVQYNGHGG